MCASRPMDRTADPGVGSGEYFLIVTSETAAAATPAHQVTFFDEDRDLVADLADYFVSHLSSGGSAIVIATQSHRHDLSVVLEGRGLSTRSMEREGRYVALDAATTLAGPLGGGGAGRPLFAPTVRGPGGRGGGPPPPVVAL